MKLGSLVYAISTASVAGFSSQSYLIENNPAARSSTQLYQFATASQGLVDVTDIWSPRDVYSMEQWAAQCGMQKADGVELYSHVGDTAPGCFDCFENVNLAATPGGMKKYESVIAAHRALLLAHFRRPASQGPASCPPPASAAEVAATDFTFEKRVFLP